MGIRLPITGKRLSSPQKHPDRFMHKNKITYFLSGPPGLKFNGYRASFPGVRQPWREAKNFPPSGAKIKNEWRYTSILLIHLHGVEILELKDLF